VTVPSNLIAGPLGFTKRDFFDAEPEASQVPTVNLGFGGGAGAGTAPPTVPPAPPTVPPAPPAAPPAP
jgi:hypothetical protein